MRGSDREHSTTHPLHYHHYAKATLNDSHVQVCRDQDRAQHHHTRTRRPFRPPSPSRPHHRRKDRPHFVRRVLVQLVRVDGVLFRLQKLRVDLAKAGDALRIWGQGEGDDLGVRLLDSRRGCR